MTGIAPILPTRGVIAAVAPSHAYDPAKLEVGLALARGAGLEVEVLPDTLRPHRYFASERSHRLAQLVTALTDPGYVGVWAIRGGSGLTSLLDDIPFEKLKPRPLIGFSDLTPLLEALRVRVGSPVVHGPVLHSLSTTSVETREAFFSLLLGRPTAPMRGRVLVPGSARGPLAGGNLCLLASTSGTPWALRPEGVILALEEVGETPYRIERMLVQLRQAGAFDDIVGVALGSFHGCHPTPDAGFTLDDIFREHLEPLNVPVLAGLPFGHGADNVGLPLGRSAQLVEAQLSWTPQAIA